MQVDLANRAYLIAAVFVCDLTQVHSDLCSDVSRVVPKRHRSRACVIALTGNGYLLP